MIQWAVARERIRKARMSGAPAPWTDDPILQTYRFCNVRRSDDRVSQWLINHVLTPGYDRVLSLQATAQPAALASFLMFTAFCRWVNWPPTIKAILEAGLWTDNPDWTAIGQKVDAIQRTGVKAWTGAYMVRAKPGDSNRGKGQFVAEDVIEKSLTPVLYPLMTCMNSTLLGREQAWKVLNGCLNWGSFMAGQVVADWGYTPLLASAPDTYTWAPVGPGSKRGFNRVMNRPLKQKIDSVEWQERLMEWRIELAGLLGPGYEDLTLHDIQNCLCETDKYLRVKNGEGRPRARYSPETRF